MNPELARLLLESVDSFNTFRKKDPSAEVDLSLANLSSARLSKANLMQARLEGANLEKADLQGAILTAANLAGANLRWAMLQGAQLNGANLAGAFLDGADLREANLAVAQLKGISLAGANLAGVRLVGAMLDDADLHNAHLEGADLQSASMVKCRLEGAHLERCRLVGANLQRAHLERANLDGAQLAHTDLQFANLDGACLRKANMEGTYVAGSSKVDIDLSGTNTKDVIEAYVSREDQQVTGDRKPRRNFGILLLVFAALGVALFLNWHRVVKALPRFGPSQREAEGKDLKAVGLIKSKQYDQAIKLCEQATSLDPAGGRYRYHEGLALLGKGQENDAIDCFADALTCSLGDEDLGSVFNSLQGLASGNPRARDGYETARLQMKQRGLAIPDNPNPR